METSGEEGLARERTSFSPAGRAGAIAEYRRLEKVGIRDGRVEDSRVSEAEGVFVLELFSLEGGMLIKYFGW